MAADVRRYVAVATASVKADATKLKALLEKMEKFLEPACKISTIVKTACCQIAAELTIVEPLIKDPVVCHSWSSSYSDVTSLRSALDAITAKRGRPYAAQHRLRVEIERLRQAIRDELHALATTPVAATIPTDPAPPAHAAPAPPVHASLGGGSGAAAVPSTYHADPAVTDPDPVPSAPAPATDSGEFKEWW